jgi:plastocyanin
MRRLPALLSTIAITAALAACTTGSAPGWTYAPAPSATPAASGAAGSPAASGATGSPAASAPASTAPSVAPSAAGSPAASGGTGGTGGAITIAAPVGAATAGFQPTTAEAAANTQFTLTFDNQDNQAPHNLILQNPDGSNVQVQGDTAFFTGPGKRDYTVPPLAAGSYKYICQVHPTTMMGELTVK